MAASKSDVGLLILSLNPTPQIPIRTIMAKIFLESPKYFQIGSMQ
ncbi:MAG: hypothetical protein CM15mP12_5690 [Gammaproteobacteria bacterium]|nr:MAG: hypothetical protein CM15mP12_5690 [Gammaproteobacteria bacterium]